MEWAAPFLVGMLFGLMITTLILSWMWGKQFCGKADNGVASMSDAQIGRAVRRSFELVKGVDAEVTQKIPIDGRWATYIIRKSRTE